MMCGLYVFFVLISLIEWLAQSMSDLIILCRSLIILYASRDDFVKVSKLILTSSFHFIKLL